MDERMTALKKASDYISEKLNFKPEIGMVLGSGLGVLGDEVENPIKIKYEDIPGFPKSTVEGHAGQLVAGTLEGKKVLVMQGRFHYYEGYSYDTVVFPVRVMKLLGINKFLVTNASGGVNKNFDPGDLMLISDHIKFDVNGPLRGANFDEFGPRFPDMSDAYKKSLREMAKEAGKSLGISRREGVYGFMGGPNYETPAEIRMLGIVGADAVGMSTAPEVLVAAHAGMDILGISCITNMAAGVLDQPLNHAEVMETAAKVRDNFIALVRKILTMWN
ncbi:MAG: purine-nucleoside phosphorylase [Spirochaetales bacterium]|nr:purine-nucleoside phosphorylase [Spirochaetales bacterium]